MPSYPSFEDSIIKSSTQSLSGSANVSATNSGSDSPGEYSELRSLNVPQSLDVKRQLSQSFQTGSSHGGSAGISKPHSRKNSLMPMKSNSDDEDDDKDGQGNERKRRDNINDKIQELLTLIPSEYFQEVPSNTQVANPNDNDAAIAAAVKNSGTKDGKPNKGQILTKSVEYLQYLQNIIDENNRKEVELRMRLKTSQLKLQNKQATPDQLNIDHTSAEKALGKIGVGPLSDEYFKEILISSTNGKQRRGSSSDS
ncbi:uncharacterized protein PRCAT00006118001 [Priceomyces carsonii]|uniref:uncharacterized protein n=1 Tax=Priceomyces carsonii TaxID=28549 RepID=UPI002EDA99A1|nr:unnamed protein product [Priceomyces carsonii]